MGAINRRIRELRKEKNWTQQALAAKLGLERSTIAKWEQENGSEPDAATIARLADIFDVSADYLLGRTPYRKSPETALYNDLPEEAKELLGDIIRDVYSRFGKAKENENDESSR